MSAYNQPGPKCPNHKCNLINCSGGIGQCPKSGCLFAYDEETQEVIKKKVMKIVNGEQKIVEEDQEEVVK